MLLLAENFLQLGIWALWRSYGSRVKIRYLILLLEINTKENRLRLLLIIIKNKSARQFQLSFHLPLCRNHRILERPVATAWLHYSNTKINLYCSPCWGQWLFLAMWKANVHIQFPKYTSGYPGWSSVQFWLWCTGM